MSIMQQVWAASCGVLKPLQQAVIRNDPHTIRKERPLQCLMIPMHSWGPQLFYHGPCLGSPDIRGCHVLKWDFVRFLCIDAFNPSSTAIAGSRIQASRAGRSLKRQQKAECYVKQQRCMPSLKPLQESTIKSLSQSCTHLHSSARLRSKARAMGRPVTSCVKT